MSSPQPLNPSRKVRLKAWLVLHEITAKSLADKLGISQQLLSMTLSGVRPDANRIDMLVQLGIPRELLPTPDRSRSS